MNRDDLDEMVSAYVECALWAGLDWTDTRSFNDPMIAHPVDWLKTTLSGIGLENK